ncbi:MAG: hypothetical protein NVSMB13_02640 [Mycobacteriales bacterium]
MTETCGPVCFLLPADMHGDRVRSAGRPGAGVEIALLDELGHPSETATEGEIAVRGPQVTTGYLHGEQGLEFAPEGWFPTGDVGRFDDGGFLYVVDRRKDMVKSGGFNVYPKEVEDALYTHPDVLEAAVVGLPDAKWMEAVHAFVAPRRGASVSGEALIAHCRRTLAAFKVPKQVVLLPRLPRTPLGKFDKRALRALGGTDTSPGLDRD